MTIDTQTGLSAAPAPSLANETLAAADRERRALARQLHELTAACNHLLYVGEFCRTDDTDSALRRLTETAPLAASVELRANLRHTAVMITLVLGIPGVTMPSLSTPTDILRAVRLAGQAGTMRY